MKTFIKKDLVERVMIRTGTRHQETQVVVDALFHVLREIMAESNPECRIEIREFGVFEVKQTKAKPKARNPKTNEVVFVPPRRKTHFRPGKTLKESLRAPNVEEITSITAPGQLLQMDRGEETMMGDQMR